MLKQRQTDEYQMLLSMGPKELEEHLEIVLAVQNNFAQLIKAYGISKEEIMSLCDLSMDQYYRRMNNSRMWNVENLLEIVREIIKDDE